MQQSITFGAKACFGAVLLNFWSIFVFWSNAPITFGAKASFVATLHHFWSKILFWSNAPSLLQTLIWEQHSITFGAKACFGATRHNFWSKSLFRIVKYNAYGGPPFARKKIQNKYGTNTDTNIEQIRKKYGSLHKQRTNIIVCLFYYV